MSSSRIGTYNIKQMHLEMISWNQKVEVDVTVVTPDAPSKAKSRVSDRLEDPTFAAALAAVPKSSSSMTWSRQNELFLCRSPSERVEDTRRVDAQAGGMLVANPVSSEEIRARLAIVIACGNALINMNAASRMQTKLSAWAAARLPSDVQLVGAASARVEWCKERTDSLLPLLKRTASRWG